ncbi:heme-degrading domain-containing protein [uncultured Microbacterium sp.]|uniref:Heme-degrading domain-containing protein n=1 Tax=uncultured Microbacterium sp. TaxID=191216 RepID=A0A1Y5P0B5_9MICO|nr:heme-binding protein [uncultured Microbacterium sp.]SBS72106.1 conserved hypothetical protein [uncultured Microbacterium sp.]
MDDVTVLAAQESELEWTRFGVEEAWALGTAVRALAVERGSGVAIDIRRPTGMILFRTALAGVTVDQDDWIRRKSAVVFRFDTSSALFAARMAAAGFDPVQGGWLEAREVAVTGGSVPIRVRGAGVVAALTISGLSSEDDHALAVEAIRTVLR